MKHLSLVLSLLALAVAVAALVMTYMRGKKDTYKHASSMLGQSDDCSQCISKCASDDKACYLQCMQASGRGSCADCMEGCGGDPQCLRYLNNVCGV